MDAATRLVQLEQEGKTTCHIEDIVWSFLHLHCNRLGIGREQEREVIGIVWCVYECMNARGGFK